MASLRAVARRFLGSCGRSSAGALAVAVTLLTDPTARAEDAAVPPTMQAQLLAKVAGYDRNLPARAQGTVRVLVVVKRDDAPSARAAAQVTATLKELPTIAALPHVEETLTYTSAADLAGACRNKRASIVYLTPSLAGESAAIGAALRGGDVLSFAAAAESSRSAVVGFDLVSGRPQLVVNVTQARHQNVALKPELLKLAKVIE
ncbi:MAG: DUF4154 domain-containing protein [Myxococcales bacterium]|nr:DUF4154 domain-containing protein [Myxococcales bacterium]